MHLKRNEFFNDSNLGGPEETLKFLSHLPIPVTIRPVTRAIVSDIIATNAPYTNASLAFAGDRATTPTNVPSVTAPFLPPCLILPQLPPVDPLSLHDILHFLPLPLDTPTHPTLDLTAHGTGTTPLFLIRTTLIFTRTLVEMESSIALDGATLQGPHASQTLGIFEPSSVSQG